MCVCGFLFIHIENTHWEKYDESPHKDRGTRMCVCTEVYWCLRVVEFVSSLRADVEDFKDLSGCCLAAWTL